MRLIKHKNNMDVAYKVDYMISHGKVCHFYGAWVNIYTSTLLTLDNDRLSIILDDLDDWLEKTVPMGKGHKDILWERYS